MTSRSRTSVDAPLPRAVIFDFDGTLLDSLPLVLRAHHHAVEPFHPRLTDAEMFERLGGPPARTLQAMLRDPTHAAEALRRIEEYWTRHEHEARPYSGAREMLTGLRARGHLLGLWTGRDRASTRRLMAAQGFDDLFAVMVCGDDLSSHKPDPAGLREVLRRLAVVPNDALYFGDASVDVFAGASCGVRTVFIRHGRESAPEVAAQAWRIVETPAEAYAMLIPGLEGQAG